MPSYLSCRVDALLLRARLLALPRTRCQWSAT